MPQSGVLTGEEMHCWVNARMKGLGEWHFCAITTMATLSAVASVHAAGRSGETHNPAVSCRWAA